jgi:hypothetical protein
VEQGTLNACSATRAIPGSANVLQLLAITVEQPRHQAPGLAAGIVLGVEQRVQFGQDTKGEGTAVAVLRGPRFETDLASIPVDLFPPETPTLERMES